MKKRGRGKRGTREKKKKAEARTTWKNNNDYRSCTELRRMGFDLPRTPESPAEYLTRNGELIGGEARTK
jgi:hypothetical protein